MQACTNGTCSTVRQMNKIERQCQETIGVTTLTVGTKISIAKNHNKKEKFKITESLDNFLYTCRSNNCNNNNTDQLIEQALKDHYNLSSFHQIINNKFKEEYLPESTTVSTTITFTTSTTVSTIITFTASTTVSNGSFTTNKQIHNYSISNIILVYGLILAFFIRFF